MPNPASQSRGTAGRSARAGLIFHEAQALDYERYFLKRPLPVDDDHLPFGQSGIQALDLISFDYGPFNLYWHTPFDTVGNCNDASLEIVGRALLNALDDLESGQTPKPTLAFARRGAAGIMRVSEVPE